MEATIKLKISELDETMVSKIKKLFDGRFVTITLSSEMDETDYLLSNPANEKFLTESMAQEPSVTFTLSEFKEHCDKLIKDLRIN